MPTTFYTRVRFAIALTVSEPIVPPAPTPQPFTVRFIFVSRVATFFFRACVLPSSTRLLSVGVADRGKSVQIISSSVVVSRGFGATYYR